MNWPIHASQLKEKVMEFSNRLRCMYRRDWELDPRILKRIYSSGTERIILYAARACWSRSGSWVLPLRLVQMQRFVLLAVSRGYRTAAKAALQVLADVPSLDYKMNLEEHCSFFQAETCAVHHVETILGFKVTEYRTST